MPHRTFFAVGILSLLIAAATSAEDAPTEEPGKPSLYARFEADGRVAYGIVKGEQVREIEGDLFGARKATDRTHALKDVRLLVPTEPRQVFALAGNYKSHLRDEIPEKFRIPQPFLKPYSSLTPHETKIVIPKNSAGDVHYEAELVIVIGRTARDVPKEQALDYVFGVTCGNDVSERYWQNDEEGKDVQWWRAKGSDTFGPCGPFIARGLDCDDLLLTLRLNGETKQKERTSQMIHGVADTVSFISRHATLHPGDLIFTGTPGETDVIRPGDVVEVELEGVGVLRNRVVKE
jgi:2-keto-4-pentenoate hydratase/2-oxohepta-3-ene-1,7-dioic acid hydratase in catechol pathway